MNNLGSPHAANVDRAAILALVAQHQTELAKIGYWTELRTTDRTVQLDLGQIIHGEREVCLATRCYYVDCSGVVRFTTAVHA